MKKLRYTKYSDALYRTAQEAEKRKCNMKSTKTWWNVVDDSDGTFYLEIPDDETDALTQSEQNKLE